MNYYYNERLKRLRDWLNLDQKDIAATLNISLQQYCRYEKGVNKMPAEYINKISIKYNVSADFILGLIDYPRPLKNGTKNGLESRRL